MKKQSFDDPVASIRTAGRIDRGEAMPSRTFKFDSFRNARRKRRKIALCLSR